MRYPGAPGEHHGFSLVEVMVALIIICVGLLGIAKLEALMLSSTGTSRLRALIALQAESLADAMHANRDFWDGSSTYWSISSDGALSVTSTQTPGANPTLTASNADLQTAMSNAQPDAEASGNICLNAACTSVQLAGDDLAEWAQNLAGVVQNSTSTIGCTNVNNVSVTTCTITVQWNENTVAANSQEAAAGAPTAFQQQTYTLVVEP
jgi:type IV pilus assembly protein PilV